MGIDEGVEVEIEEETVQDQGIEVEETEIDGDQGLLIDLFNVALFVNF